MSSLPLGNISDIAGFSPADFGDAEDIRPFAVQIDPTGQGSLTPYSTLVNNVFLRQTTEIKEKTVSPSPTPQNWRRRLREFMHLKNEDLVTFLRKPLEGQSPIVQASAFLGKFGRPDFQATHPSLHSTFLDISGSSHMNNIKEEMQKIGPSSPQEVLDQVRWAYDMYRQAGEECLSCEAKLRLKLDIMDKTYQKIIGFADLPVNEDSEKVAVAIEAYVKRLLEDNEIEKSYNDTVEAYRKFAAYKELIQLFRFTDLQEKEPLCSICLTESVSFVLTPCGHTFCGTCMKRQSHACYMCRSAIRDRIKVYFG